MSISASLANALSGLTAASRSAEVVSSNVANALTDGYARRDIILTPQQLGGSGAGVRVSAVVRNVDAYVLSERRLSDAAVAYQDTLSDFYTRLQTRMGAPDDAASLTGRINGLESAFIEAASRPDSDNRLQGVVDAASRLAAHINDVSDQIQGLREQADQSIARQVDRLNEGLTQVQAINVQIRSMIGSGIEVNTLMDQRQRIVDELSEIVPLRVAERQGGQIALYTTGGAILLDGQAATIGFSAVGTITADMTVASGALSELTLNGRPTSADLTGRLGGGSLGAAFDVRDTEAPAAQVGLDALARDLLERFADPTVDPSLALGDPGIFTDGGGAFIATDEVGLAGRLSINAAIDPSQGGAVWRVRDGIGATAPGDVGYADLINALNTALTGSRVVASGPFGGVSRTASGLAGEYLTGLNARQGQADRNAAFAAGQRDTLKMAELQNGVDSDHEMEKLLLIEQSYAANARVITVADEMLDQLLRM